MEMNEYDELHQKKNLMELNLSTKVHVWHCFIKLVNDENYTNEDKGNTRILRGNIKQKNSKNI